MKGICTEAVSLDIDRRVKKKDVAPVLSYDPEIEAEAASNLNED